MGATKTDLFTREQNELANLAKAIAHPARIAILQQLMSTNCGDDWLKRGWYSKLL